MWYGEGGTQNQQSQRYSLWLDEEGLAGHAREVDLVSKKLTVVVKGIIGTKEQKEKCTSQLMLI